MIDCTDVESLRKRPSSVPICGMIILEQSVDSYLEDNIDWMWGVIEREVNPMGISNGVTLQTTRELAELILETAHWSENVRNNRAW